MMWKWSLIYIVLLTVPVYGQEQEAQKPLTFQQMVKLDRIEWRTISFANPVPSVVSVRSIQKSIEGRTSMFVHPEQQWIAYDISAFRQYPFLHLEMCDAPPPLSLEDKLHFRDFFNTGGTLYLDYCSHVFPHDWKKWGMSIYSEVRWEELNSTHVLSHSFYLLEKRILLEQGHSSIYVLKNDGRIIMVLNQSSRFSWKRFRQSPTSKTYNAPDDEMRLRFYINLMMYLLTGDYKSDQLHLPTILLRRK
ncbi:MAG: DUF4159 domain-containing protein [SAR324 cluster bacterium]|nr:DUF4159 domain-containing protein [SAR324 cluster bacterium]